MKSEQKTKKEGKSQEKHTHLLISVHIGCQVPMCVSNLLPGHAFKLFPINESDLLGCCERVSGAQKA